MSIDGMILLIVGFVILVVVAMVLEVRWEAKRREEKKYCYQAKNHIMTRYEERFFKILNEIFADRCYVIPQVHLSALLNFKISGQNWRGAFLHINGKSVDFVLLRRDNFEVICAVELDDASHESLERKKRDEEVERIFREAKLPLVRFRNVGKMSKQEIVDRVAEAMNGLG